MPPTLTDRIAGQLIRVASERLKSDSIRLDKAGRVTADPLQRAIAQLAAQLARQGLSPVDLDRPEGREALEAIVSVINPKRADAAMHLLLALPDEWKHAVNAAYRLADHIAHQVNKG